LGKEKSVMKKIVAVLLVAVCCLLWAGCAQATNSDGTQKEEEKQEEQESQKAKENREYYKNNLIGKWYSQKTAINFDDYTPGEGYGLTLTPDGNMSEFREDGFTIGGAGLPLTVDGIDFETLFDKYIPYQLSEDKKFEPSDLKSDTVYLKIYTDANKESFVNYILYFYRNKNYDARFLQKYTVNADGSGAEGGGSAYYIKEGSENHKKQQEEEEEDKKTIDIRGSYTLTDNNNDHTLTFNNDGTYDFENVVYASWNRSNSWSANKNEITMGYEAGGTEYTEVLVASKSGTTVTLEVKDSSALISQVRGSFSLTTIDRKMILEEK
jgi:hypothetical protein